MPFINTLLSKDEHEEERVDVQENHQATTQETVKKDEEINHTATLHNTSEILLSSTAEGLSGIEELKSTMESIAAAAEESAGAAEESLGAVNAVKINSSQILKMSNISVENIKKLENSILDASQKINESSENMLRIAKSAQNVYEVGERLNNAGEEVSQTVSLITKLAKRTSLLALNAAIEASRAQERGRGFSVIAKEIRALSSKSNNYAQEINSIVSKIQTNVNNVRETIIKTKDAIEISSGEASQNAISMKELIQTLLLIVEDVNKSVKEFQELDEKIMKMQLSSETIASAAEESAGAVSEVTQTISMQATAFNQSNSAAKMLEEMALKLKNNSSINEEEIVNDIASAAEELSSAIEEIENSMSQSMVALSQIEEAANISKDDAGKNIIFAKDANKIAMQVDESIAKINLEIQEIKEKFNQNIENINKAGVDSRQNLQHNEDVLDEAKKMKRNIKYLKKILRKIELTIVQTASLSINGSVEAMQAKDAQDGCSEGFSVVSNDIRNLAQNSEQSLDKVNDIVDNLEDETESIIEAVDKMQMLGVREADSIILLSSEMQNSAKEIDQSVAMFMDIDKKLDSIVHALQEAQVGAEQTKTAADLALNNAAESKIAAQHITSVSQTMAENVSDLIEVAALLKDE